MRDYNSDPLARDWRGATRRIVPEVAAERDLVVELPDDHSDGEGDGDGDGEGDGDGGGDAHGVIRGVSQDAAHGGALAALGALGAVNGADNASGFVGAVVLVDAGNVHLEDRHGRVRVFPLGAGFLVDGEPVVLVAPPEFLFPPAPLSRRVAPTATLSRAPGVASTDTSARPFAPASAAPTGGLRPSPGRARTASGSFAVPDARARVARASRIWVECRHDAELVEQVWGDDLRLEGVVVEQLEGADHLAERLIEFDPASGRRIGVLLDHWVAGSKESRLATDALARVDARHVLVVGHPFIDIWQAVRPKAVGIAGWPNVPRSEDWKTGTCRALGWPHESAADRAAAWRRIRGSVRGYADLDPALLGRVEQLIDFVTAE